MEKPGQSTALRAQFSPAVVALTAVRSRRVLSMPDVLKAGFKDSTATVTWIGHFHGAGLPNSQTKSARASSLTDPAPAGVSAQSPGSIPTVPPVQRPDSQRPDPKAAGSRDLAAFLDDSAALLDSARVSAAGEARLFGFVEAADFAGEVEEIARSVEYLQVVAAQAVERTRTEAQQTKPGPSAAAPQWRTGWTEPATDATAPGVTVPEATDPGVTVPGAASVLDDGYRNAAQFLRARLRIGIGEAKRRLALAPDVLPQTGMAGQNIPARHAILSQAVGSALVPSRSASIISTALDKVRNLTDEDTLTRMEHALTTTAVETDPDFVTTMAKRWIDAIDHDGPEPTEEILRQLQGVFLRRQRRHGLHHLEIFATDEQYEILTTAMNVATNPRLTTPGTGTTENTETGDNPHNNPHNSPGTGTGTSPDLDLDRRSRPQKLLNGLTSACSLAMRTEKLPANGGLPPQLTVTIGYQELLEQVHNHHHNPGTGTGTAAGLGTGAGTAPVTGIGTGAGIGTGTATFTGPMHPNTIRKIACDADILPVVLGSDSRILDIGRTTRIFPPHIRKAITARDQGCAFPDCTMPAPWCEAHHTTYWSHGGTTSTDNGTLLCSHHHHLIHKEQWRIDIKTGIPWFIPPPHIDPHQTPRRNHHHTPHRT
ncbi:HNH endonuclease signature motif containing protein [Arthrobacter sp. D5-1]|uniref:HNH endonuclease signature motif containing protein n=1 Tax=Arthrobacter sp. D5-1 TaxID=1477518 RepID=UPI001A9A1CD5|nr:HNH endonuclease signature motif containing protein [Arthrobacter sp. D5-1]QSZ48803.1 HNH endonuclease [Arthrobacter sp. D5-1]